MKYVIIAIAILFPSILHADSLGSVYVSKLSANVNWEGNETGATHDSVFEIILDGKHKKSISAKNDAQFEGLKLGKKHSVKIILNGKALESFFFKFEDFECDKLWLYYKEMYGTWSLRTTSWKCKR